MEVNVEHAGSSAGIDTIELIKRLERQQQSGHISPTRARSPSATVSPEPVVEYLHSFLIESGYPSRFLPQPALKSVDIETLEEISESWSDFQVYQHMVRGQTPTIRPLQDKPWKCSTYCTDTAYSTWNAYKKAIITKLRHIGVSSTYLRLIKLNRTMQRQDGLSNWLEYLVFQILLLDGMTASLMKSRRGIDIVRQNLVQHNVAVENLTYMRSDTAAIERDRTRELAQMAVSQASRSKLRAAKKNLELIRKRNTLISDFIKDVSDFEAKLELEQKQKQNVDKVHTQLGELVSNSALRRSDRIASRVRNYYT